MAKKPTKHKASADAAPRKSAGQKSAPKSAAASGPGKPVAPAKSQRPAPKTPSKAIKPVKAEAKPQSKAQHDGKAEKAAPKAAKGAVESKKRPSATPAKAPPKSAPAPESPKPETGSKSGRKGITIVTPKPAKKPKPKSSPSAVPALTGSILGMGLGTGRPLIPSGPAAESLSNSERHDLTGSRKPKSPFTKRQLDKFLEILLAKRRELLGDINSMEKEALKSQSGSLSHLPQHMAEQGSETYEQSLSLDLAAADRVLLREIDGALQRIADRTYGLCERTGKPISKERLAELPWARYSIEAAREMERRTT